MKKAAIRRWVPAGLATLLFALALACSSQAAEPAGTPLPTVVPNTAGPTRPFLMGFTPFPYDLNEDALEWVYAHMAVDGDIVAHHFDQGVPWPEALAGDEFDAHLTADWAYRKAHTPVDSQVYVAITPINSTRDNLARYQGERGDMDLPAPWDTYTFDSPEVVTAYINYAEAVVDYFEPDYLAIGIEVNLLAAKSPELWPGYVELQRQTYQALKARYPDLPIFVSFLGNSLLEGFQADVDHALQLQTLDEALPYSDYFGISLYPYLSTHLAEDVPESMWADLFGMSDKPIAITETGYVAEAVALAGGAAQVNGSPEKQAAFIGRMLQEAQERDFVFVINFVLRDFDLLYAQVPAGQQEIALPWRDSGLYDGEGQPRPSLEIWRAALARPYAAGN